mmetsp:Transcript_43053/g.129292  ORF Transcript_43053/g.129292 Transcript_43053/m.129292 type:complete len:323 (-) Transcript_43053:37-1005(-)
MRSLLTGPRCAASRSLPPPLPPLRLRPCVGLKPYCPAGIGGRWTVGPPPPLPPPLPPPPLPPLRSGTMAAPGALPLPSTPRPWGIPNCMRDGGRVPPRVTGRPSMSLDGPPPRVPGRPSSSYAAPGTAAGTPVPHPAGRTPWPACGEPTSRLLRASAQLPPRCSSVPPMPANAPAPTPAPAASSSAVLPRSPATSAPHGLTGEIPTPWRGVGIRRVPTPWPPPVYPLTGVSKLLLRAMLIWRAAANASGPWLRGLWAPASCRPRWLPPLVRPPPGHASMSMLPRAPCSCPCSCSFSAGGRSLPPPLPPPPLLPPPWPDRWPG